MSRHRYRVYYEFNGPTKSDQLRTVKNEEQIAGALERVEFELSVLLDDDSAQISTLPDGANAIILTVETEKTNEAFTLVLTNCLNGLDLFAANLQ